MKAAITSNIHFRSASTTAVRQTEDGYVVDPEASRRLLDRLCGRCSPQCDRALSGDVDGAPVDVAIGEDGGFVLRRKGCQDEQDPLR